MFFVADKDIQQWHLTKLAVNRDIDCDQMHFEKRGNQDSLWYTTWYFKQIEDMYSYGLCFNNANQR